MLRFFSDNKTAQAINRLATAKHLSVFVGAGASKEVGLPTWGELVKRLSSKVVPGSFQGLARDAVEGFIENSGALAAAERIAASLKPERLQELIRLALYQNDNPGSLIPGPLTRAVARLKHVDPDLVRVTTTNYDQLLVQAMRDAKVAGTKSYCTDTTQAASVIHLHGVIGFAKPADGQNDIVLTERDFLAPQSGGWRRDVVTKALTSGPCLFVGVSLTDLNLLSPLYQSHGVHRHVVIYTRTNDIPNAAIHKIETIERKRWQRLSVDCLFADNYADSSVFVNEVARCRQSQRPTDLPDRIRTWNHDVVQPYVPPAPADYTSVQQHLSGKLQELLTALQNEHGMQHEVMQLGLFGLGIDGEREFARVLATSDRTMKDPRSSEQLQVRLPTNWTGIKSMCSGVPVCEPKDNYASRWKHILAVPVTLPALAHAPVGAIVLSSTAPNSTLSQVQLSALLTNSPAKLYGALEEAGAQVLSPA